MRRVLVISTLCAATVTACVSGKPASDAAPQPTNSPEPSEETTHDEAAAAGFGPWTAELGADHPLVGTAWAVAEARPLARAELEQRLADARFVLLGETHDNPDHHRLQGELLTALSRSADAAGRPGPAVAYEMLDPADQAAIDEYLAAVVAGATAEVDAFAELVGWADSGWPAWSLYRPAFAPALTTGLPILAAQFPRAQTRRFMGEGLAMLPAELVSRYALDQPLPAELLAAGLDEMFASHCEMVPREQLTPMVEIQRVRDAVMAAALERGAADRGQAVLIAGTGHTRASGVPRLLTDVGEDPSAVVSVGFVAVRPGVDDPREYAEGFDVVVLTPDVAREDPCAQMR